MKALLDSSAKLPDCRAFEQASPIEKNGVDTRGMAASVRASVSGDAVSFLTTSGIPVAKGTTCRPNWRRSTGLVDSGASFSSWACGALMEDIENFSAKSLTV